MYPPFIFSIAQNKFILLTLFFGICIGAHAKAYPVALHKVLLNGQEVGYLVSSGVKEPQLPKGFSSFTLTINPKKDEGELKTAVLRLWLKKRHVIEVSEADHKLFDEAEEQLVEEGYFLPFSVFSTTRLPNNIQPIKILKHITLLAFNLSSNFLVDFEGIIEGLEGSKIHNAFYNIEQLNLESWRNNFRTGYGVEGEINEGYMLPKLSASMFAAYQEGSFGYAFKKHIEQLSGPLNYHYKGIGLSGYIRSVFDPAHDAYHPILDFSTEIDGEAGILGFESYYGIRKADPFFIPSSLIGLGGGILKAVSESETERGKSILKNRSKNQKRELLCRMLTNIWRGKEYAKFARDGFYSHQWFSEVNLQTNINDIRRALRIPISNTSTELTKNCRSHIEAKDLKPLSIAALGVLKNTLISDDPFKARTSLLQLGAQLDRLMLKLHGAPKIKETRYSMERYLSTPYDK